MALAALAAGCGGCGSPVHNPAEARSAEVRVEAPDVSPADALQLAADNRAFAVDLYRAVRGTGAGNLVLSPWDNPVPGPRARSDEVKPAGPLPHSFRRAA